MEGLEGHFGRSGGSFWGHFGSLSGVWAPSASSGRPGRLLERLRLIFGSQHAPRMVQLGFQNEAKIEQKSKQKSINFLMPLGVGFWSGLDGFWEAKWRQVGTKMASKIDVNFERPILQKNLIKPMEC